MWYVWSADKSVNTQNTANRSFLRNHHKSWMVQSTGMEFCEWPRAWWEVTLEMSGFPKNLSTGSSKAWQKRVSCQYFDAAVDDSECCILGRSAHFGQCPCGRQPYGFKLEFQDQKQEWRTNVGKGCSKNSGILEISPLDSWLKVQK